MEKQKKFITSIFDGQYQTLQNEYPNWKLKDLKEWRVKPQKSLLEQRLLVDDKYSSNLRIDEVESLLSPSMTKSKSQSKDSETKFDFPTESKSKDTDRLLQKNRVRIHS